MSLVTDIFGGGPKNQENFEAKAYGANNGVGPANTNIGGVQGSAAQLGQAHAQGLDLQGAQGLQGANVVNAVNAGQANQAYSQSQGALGQQQGLINALQGQNGIGNQSSVYNQMQGVANGQGPNPAQAMLAQATGNNTANQAALMAGQRGAGANAGLMARQAAQQGAANQQGAAGQAATMQANQSLNALNQMGGIAGQQVGNQIGATQQLNQNTQGQQGMLLGAINAQNSANVQNQSALNNANVANQSALNNARVAMQSNVNQGNLGMQENLNNSNVGMQSNINNVNQANQANLNNSNVAMQSNINNANEGMSTNMNAANSGMAQTNANNNAKFQAGLINSAGGALTKLIGLSKGGKVTPNPKIAAVSPHMRFEGVTQMPEHLSNVRNIYHGNKMDVPKYSGGGEVDALVSPGEIYLPKEKAKAVAKGKETPMAGEKIPGKAIVKGDSKKNDIVPKKLERGGVVIPRSVLESNDPESNAAKFVADHLSKKDKGSNHQKDFQGALKRAVAGRNKK